MLIKNTEPNKACYNSRMKCILDDTLPIFVGGTSLEKLSLPMRPSRILEFVGDLSKLVPFSVVDDFPFSRLKIHGIKELMLTL